ncbi:hypothetical protein J7E96_23390 [Streptomyces sp. ISL-96]|uniref:hypothetical protein n=1 Tax=Streptomyces sp. ISL-96 TaxID=2819191 RepID=UPI001BE54F34|nr:hypothetical protein [Streptomyces sp. ISL-96]MBT2491414.1 hypothetical protein [Streptomyces sp. ISL-96]
MDQQEPKIISLEQFETLRTWIYNLSTKDWANRNLKPKETFNEALNICNLLKLSVIINGLEDWNKFQPTERKPNDS